MAPVIRTPCQAPPPLTVDVRRLCIEKHFSSRRKRAVLLSVRMAVLVCVLTQSRPLRSSPLLTEAEDAKVSQWIAAEFDHDCHANCVNCSAVERYPGCLQPRTAG